MFLWIRYSWIKEAHIPTLNMDYLEEDQKNLSFCLTSDGISNAYKFMGLYNYERCCNDKLFYDTELL